MSQQQTDDLVQEDQKIRAKRSSPNSVASKLKIVVPEPVFKKIDIQNLVPLIGKENVLFVDVRDEDYEGGHLKGAINYPFSFFEDRVSSLVKIVREKTVIDTVVFYCMYSEQRGPQCATVFAEAFNENTEGNQLKILVPSGGFNAFLKKYPAPNEWIEDHLPDCYVDIDGQLFHKVDARYLDVIGDKSSLQQ